MERKIVVNFIGLSGSGKGTQAKMLVEEFDWLYLSSGDLCRESKKIGDFTGRKVGRIIDAGTFIPSAIMSYLTVKRLEEIKQSGEFDGLVIDGATRKLFEAITLDEALRWYEWDKNLHILLIDISKKEAIRRLSNRWTCVGCGKVYSYLEKPRAEGVCDACGGKLRRRDDDTPEGINGRIQEFKDETSPVLDYYKKQGRLICINGEQPIEDVHKDILKALGEK